MMCDLNLIRSNLQSTAGSIITSCDSTRASGSSICIRRSSLPNSSLGIPCSTNINEAWRHLSDSFDHALPVFWSNSEDSSYCGWISMLDLVCYVVDASHHIISALGRGDINSCIELNEESTTKIMGELKDLFSQSEKVRCVSCINLSCRDRWFPTSVDATVFQTCQILATNVQRLPLFKGDALMGVFTHFHVLREIRRHLKSLPIFATSLSQLVDENRHPLIKMRSSDPALHGLYLMAEYGVTGIAVVDNKNGGQLVGNFSSTSIHNLHGRYELLALPVLSLSSILNPSAPNRPLTALITDSIESVLDIMWQNKVNRVYIVDNTVSLIPLGIVTTTDLLRYFCGLNGAIPFHEPRSLLMKRRKYSET